MTFEGLHNLSPTTAPAGFSHIQFKKLDEIYCTAASRKTLSFRTVECDFDEGVASYTYYRAHSDTPYLQFVIRKVGPRSTMYELYKQDKGRIAKSGVFEAALDRLRTEVEILSLNA